MDLQIGCHHGNQAKGSCLPIDLHLQLQREAPWNRIPRMVVPGCRRYPQTVSGSAIALCADSRFSLEPRGSSFSMDLRGSSRLQRKSGIMGTKFRRSHGVGAESRPCLRPMPPNEWSSHPPRTPLILKYHLNILAKDDS